MTVQLLNKTKLNNRGASVIELIIIMAILAVLLSGSIIAFSLLNAGSVKNASRTTKTFIEKTRTSAMSVMAEEWNFTISMKDEEYVAKVTKIYKSGSDTVTEVLEEKSLGSRLSAYFVADGSELSLGADDVLKITFDKSSGKVEKVLLTRGGTATEYKPSDGMITILFKSGKTNKNSVKLYFVSGKVMIE